MNDVQDFGFEPCRILLDDTQALLIDVQEKLMPHIENHAAITQKIITLIEGLQVLGVPVMRNEQYKKGLGDTLPQIVAALNEENQISFEKLSFSVCDNPESYSHITKQERQTVLLFGIETHVCVLQTALDLLDQGFQPVIVADAVGSRNAFDKKTALHRMRDLGMVVTTVESILFELCRTAQNPHFKAISKLIK